MKVESLERRTPRISGDENLRVLMSAFHPKQTLAAEPINEHRDGCHPFIAGPSASSSGPSHHTAAQTAKRPSHWHSKDRANDIGH